MKKINFRIKKKLWIVLFLLSAVPNELGVGGASTCHRQLKNLPCMFFEEE